MRVVFDTNVYVSAFVMPGSRGDEAVARAIDNEDDLLVSQPILDELLGVLARKFSRRPEELARIALLLDSLAEWVEPPHRLTVLADDPDNRILECAVAGSADVIVTGDKGLLALGTWQGIEVITLARYLDT